MKIFESKTIVVTGGTGSLGNALIRRIMTGETGRPKKVIVFSRDELKQHEMRVQWHKGGAMEDLRDFSPRDVLEWRIGDVRLYDTLLPVLRRADVVLNTAALKQVPACEYAPFEAVRTNIEGPYNIVRGIREHNLPVSKVVTISTDKACKPVNVMGMTKAIQERVILSGNLECPGTSFLAVRYGNVVASRGSVVPHFQAQIAQGGPVTITSPKMTRFLLTIDQAVDIVFEALRSGERGEMFIPRAPSARVIDIAGAMIGTKSVRIEEIGIRPGEKFHEVLVSEEECARTEERNGYYIISNILPELRHRAVVPALSAEYSSAQEIVPRQRIAEILRGAGFEATAE